eukprot:TRINITY_DN11305_c0_g1_i2.p1 TRINITY_DN11305_c0_g1~~TRINITY_DN11305_c0_g1_i2.p1  ORF type:complete len:142 (-),score=1.54 TRINITY_DN11305_c0_g1_i2:39-464(-)
MPEESNSSHHVVSADGCFYPLKNASRLYTICLCLPRAHVTRHNKRVFDMCCHVQSAGALPRASQLSVEGLHGGPEHGLRSACELVVEEVVRHHGGHYEDCLLYTSDAADEEDSVDLGGRRIIKKKKRGGKKKTNNMLKNNR